MYLVMAATHLLAAAPVVDPGGAVAPPGADGFKKLLQWALWLGFAACFAGLVKAAGGMALAGAGRSGGGAHEHTMGVAISLIGALLCSSAALLVGAMS
jgi:hypothetical protein